MRRSLSSARGWRGACWLVTERQVLTFMRPTGERPLARKYGCICEVRTQRRVSGDLSTSLSLPDLIQDTTAQLALKVTEEVALPLFVLLRRHRVVALPRRPFTVALAGLASLPGLLADELAGHFVGVYFAPEGVADEEWVVRGLRRPSRPVRAAEYQGHAR